MNISKLRFAAAPLFALLIGTSAFAGDGVRRIDKSWEVYQGQSDMLLGTFDTRREAAEFRESTGNEGSRVVRVDVYSDGSTTRREVNPPGRGGGHPAGSDGDGARSKSDRSKGDRSRGDRGGRARK